MSHAQPKHYSAATHRAVTSATASRDAIEWEELPSFAGSLARRLIQRGSWQPGQAAQPRGANDSDFMESGSFGLSWDHTMPAALDPAPMSMPFHEPLAGLSTREVIEPDVFMHFFGPSAEER